MKIKIIEDTTIRGKVVARGAIIDTALGADENDVKLLLDIGKAIAVKDSPKVETAEAPKKAVETPEPKKPRVK